MKAVSSAVMRDLDRKTAIALDIETENLMDQAGFGVARVVHNAFQARRGDMSGVLLIAGRGNNGGDAFAAARYLKEFGTNAEVWIAGAAADIRGDALDHFSRMKADKVPYKELPVKEDWDDAVARLDASRDVGYNLVVDGILGTGISGPARGPAAGAIRLVNTLARHAYVVAIDVPSGLNADTGEPEGDTVTADVTVTIGLPKRGLLLPAAINHVGSVMVVDLGIPPDLLDELEPGPELITSADLRPVLPRRRRDTHKGTYGHVLIFAGGPGYTGAATLAARAALRSGAGLVTVVTPRGLVETISGRIPEAMTHGGHETEAGSLSVRVWEDWKPRISGFTAVLAGPGLTRHPDTTALIERLVRECPLPLVLDADAFYALAGRPEMLSHSCGPVVLTPHPGELGLMLGRTATDIQANRFESAREASDRTHAVVVLKGAGTLIAAPGRPLQVNLTGNPGMARGGMGDALAGLLAGLAAQGVNPFEAARLAVYLHGRAGDEAARMQSQYTITAWDLIEMLPYAFQEICPR